MCSLISYRGVTEFIALTVNVNTFGRSLSLSWRLPSMQRQLLRPVTRPGSVAGVCPALLQR